MLIGELMYSSHSILNAAASFSTYNLGGNALLEAQMELSGNILLVIGSILSTYVTMRAE